MKKAWYAVRGYLRTTDRWLLLFWLLTSGVSILYLAGLYNSGLSYDVKIYSQVMGIAIGLVAALVISLFDYKSLLKLWKIYLPICFVLVLLTFFVGTVRGGDRAWLVLKMGSFSLSLQPSELLKISFITTFAMHIEKVQDNLNSPMNMLFLCLHGGAHVLFIQIQGDGGTALIFLFIFVIMLFCAGINWKYMLAAVAAAAAFLPVLWFKIMTEDQKMRILAVYLEEFSERYEYQQLRSAIALGVGGLQGTGIFTGQHVRVPEIYNDFIFAFIGESSGFMGCMGVILLLVAICMKLLFNSFKARDATGKFICIGLFAMFLSQTVINLGMCIGVLPVIGVTLPLLSSGGSSVLSLYLGLGLVLSVYRHSNTALFYGR